LQYKQSELIKYFNRFNTCAGSPVESFVYKQNRDFLNLRITPGLNYSSMTISSLAVEFKPKVNIRLGLDAEIILPFNKNKWALVFEPTYNSFNSEGESNIGKLSITYNYIEFPFGLRYYFFLNSETKLFVNGYMLPGYVTAFNNTIVSEYPGAPSYKLNYYHSIHYYAMGGGISFNRFSAEMRYYTGQNPLLTNSLMTSEYKRLAVIFGFRFL
jgi:hypothetical protein